MKKPFTRRDLTSGDLSVLHKGRWGNADLYIYEQNNRAWVIKDFSFCPPIVYKTWGRFLIMREYHALARLQGIRGVPESPFILNRYAFCYRYTPGQTLRETQPEMLDEAFFYKLEHLVEQIHARHMVHLDIRNRRNILVVDNKEPVLLDFQSSLKLDRVPRTFHKLLKDIDISGVYKMWQLKKPDSMDINRQRQLANLNKKRFLWVLKGYPFGTRKDPRK